MSMTKADWERALSRPILHRAYSKDRSTIVTLYGENPDSRVFIGMTPKDLDDDLEYALLFKNLDKNKNNILDEDEYNDHCRPIIDLQRQGSKLEYKVDMKKEDIQDSYYKNAFCALDLDNDGILSKEEILKYQDYVIKKSQYAKAKVQYDIEMRQFDANRQRIKKYNKDNMLNHTAAGAGCGVIIGWLVSHMNDTEKWNDEFHDIDLIRDPKWKKIGRLVFLGLTVVGATVGLLTNKRIKEPEKAEEKFKDLPQLDKQYENVCNPDFA